MKRLWLGTSVLFAAIACTVAGESIVRDRKSVIDLATERTSSTARLIALHGESAIEDANKIVTIAISRVADWDLKDREKGREIGREMKLLSAGSPHIFATWVSDGLGRNVADSLSDTPADVNASERPFFLAHLNGAPEPIIIAEASRGMISGKPRFTFSRSIRNPDGSLKAVIACAMHSDYFDTIYRSTINWPDARAGLYTRGNVLARKADQTVANRNFIEAFSQEVDKEPFGSRILPDGQESRLISWSHMSQFPSIYATASLAVGPMLAEWRSRAWITVSITFAAIVAFAAFIRTWARASDDRARMLMSETTVREVHHRVRNSLQMVSSILTLRSRNVDGQAKAALDDVRLQIHAIAEAHRLLQNAALLEWVDVADIIERLCQNTPHSDLVRLTRVTQPAMVSGESATALAIIGNELITNALKHASAQVHVAVTSDADGHRLSVEDDGPGVPADFDIDQTRGFGLRAIRLMTEKIGGSLTWHPRLESGTVFVLCLPRERSEGALRKPAASAAAPEASPIRSAGSVPTGGIS